MKHKLKKLSAAVLAATGCLAATGAFALPLAQYDGSVLEVFVSGASAQDKALERLFAVQCNAGSLDEYMIAGDTNQRMMFCTVSSSGVPGFPGGGQKVAFYKSSVGGSGNGVQPVANQTAVPFLNRTTLSSCSATVVPSSGGIPSYNLQTCNGSTTNRVPVAGISDVEPALFGASTSDIAKLNVFSQNQVVWGVPITKALRDRLQTLQGLAVGSETEANMPSLSREQVAGLYSDFFLGWSDLVNASGTPVAASGSALDPIYMCRRVPSSGTQASFDAMFLKNRCLSGAPTMPTAAANPGRVNEGSGTGNVVSCLGTHNAAGRYAIGLFSTENVEDANWRFIKVDGVAPSLVNVAKGHYPFFSEQSIQWRKPGFNPPSGLTATLLTNVKNEAGSPAIIRSLNASFTHSWGHGGLLALPTIHTPASAPFTQANVANIPVSTQTKSPFGQPNNCLEPVPWFTQQM